LFQNFLYPSIWYVIIWLWLWSVTNILHSIILYNSIINFIQLVSSQLVDWFSQTKLYWKALNEGYLYICEMYKSNNKQLRYQAISNYKSFISWYLMNGWMDLHDQACIRKCSSNHFQWYIVYFIVINIHRDTSISM